MRHVRICINHITYYHICLSVIERIIDQLNRKTPLLAFWILRPASEYRQNAALTRRWLYVSLRDPSINKHSACQNLIEHRSAVENRRRAASGSKTRHALGLISDSALTHCAHCPQLMAGMSMRSISSSHVKLQTRHYNRMGYVFDVSSVCRYGLTRRTSFSDISKWQMNQMFIETCCARAVQLTL